MVAEIRCPRTAALERTRRRRRRSPSVATNGSLLRLQSGSKHFVRVRGGAGADLADDRRHRDAEPLRVTVIPLLAHLEPRELELEVLVQRKLHGHVGQSEESRRQARVE